MRTRPVSESSDTARTDGNGFRQAVDDLAKRRYPRVLSLTRKMLRSRRLSHTRRASLYYLRADALMEMDRSKEAIHAYSKGIKYRFELDGMLGRGHARYYLKQYGAALFDYRAVIKINPAHAIALKGAGNALIRLKRFREALQMMQRALAAKPDYAAAKETLEQLRVYLKAD